MDVIYNVIYAVALALTIWAFHSWGYYRGWWAAHDEAAERLADLETGEALRMRLHELNSNMRLIPSDDQVYDQEADR